MTRDDIIWKPRDFFSRIKFGQYTCKGLNSSSAPSIHHNLQLFSIVFRVVFFLSKMKKW